MTHRCISGDVKIVTNTGLGSAKDLYNIGAAVKVEIAETIADKLDTGIKQESSSIFKVGENPILEVKTEEGYSVEVTPNHKLYLETDEWRKAKNLKEEQRVKLLDHQGFFGTHGTYEEGILQGMLSENISPQFTSQDISVTFEEITPSSVELSQLYEWTSALARKGDEDINMSSVTTKQFEYILEESPLDRNKIGYNVPDIVFTGSKDLVRGFLQSVFEIEGSVKNPSDGQMYLELDIDNQEYLYNIQLLLLNFGVKSNVNNGKLNVSGYNITMYKENIGFLNSNTYKSNRFESCYVNQEDTLEEVKEDYLAKISDIEYIGDMTVYSLSEPVSNSYIANGFVSQSTFSRR